MACAAPELRERQLEQYLKGFRQYNPNHSEEELTDIRSDMENLIQRKLKMFPDDQRQIVDARIVPFGDGALNLANREQAGSCSTEAALRLNQRIGKDSPIRAIARQLSRFDQKHLDFR